VNRKMGLDRGKLTWSNIWRGATLAFNVMLHVGVLSDYRRPFWRAFRYALRRGQIDGALGMGFVAHHLVQFSREAIRGEQNASFYSAQPREISRDRDASGRVAEPLRKSA
jgi:hypothetical protein